MEITAIIFFLMMIIIAWLVFRVLRRAFKLAVRAVIVLIILVIAIVGGIALWNLDSEGSADTRVPAAKKSR